MAVMETEWTGMELRRHCIVELRIQTRHFWRRILLSLRNPGVDPLCPDAQVREWSRLRWYSEEDDGTQKRTMVLRRGRWYPEEDDGTQKRTMVLRRGRWYSEEDDGTQKRTMVPRRGRWYSEEDDGTQKRTMVPRRGRWCPEEDRRGWEWFTIWWRWQLWPVVSASSYLALTVTTADRTGDSSDCDSNDCDSNDCDCSWWFVTLVDDWLWLLLAMIVTLMWGELKTKIVVGRKEEERGKDHKWLPQGRKEWGKEETRGSERGRREKKREREFSPESVTRRGEEST